jgi:hypothetical protein
MAVMLVQVFPLPIAFIHRLALHPDAVCARIFGIMLVRMQVLMEMGMAVACNPMGVPVLMDMAMGVLVLILVVMVILLFHGPYFSLLTCTNSERYSALSASVV